ncbi:MAG: TauD/TfdA family dioxygenase [Verrucomicrobiales bacterium]|nr:TauD/TfdA family dioxygenase [Verrucomicrobiales bacterium]
METPLLNHPAVWRGSELFARPDWIHKFETADWLAIRNSLENGSGAVLVRGFPVDDFSRDEARAGFLELCRERLGTPVSQNDAGDLVFDVADSGFKSDDPRARGPNTKKKLSFHTDRCDVIAFLCWRQAKTGGENEIVSSMTLYNRIREQRPDLLKILCQPFVYKRHTVDLGNEKPYCEQPVFSFCDGHFAANFLRVLIDRADSDPDLPNLSAAQKEAMDFLEEVAGDPEIHVRFRQEPGDILLLNNWVTLHRRSAFEDHAEPEKKRCLFRVWLSMPNSRPLDPMFEDNYGAVEAGAIRGGMRART